MNSALAPGLFVVFIWWVTTFPRSLRVNLDMGKSAYGWMIMKDENIPGTVVRTSTIPEELGRLVYLLTDKTGRNPGRLVSLCYSDVTISDDKLWSRTNMFLQLLVYCVRRTSFFQNLNLCCSYIFLFGCHNRDLEILGSADRQPPFQDIFSISIQ